MTVTTSSCRGALDTLLEAMHGRFKCREVDGVSWIITPYRLPDGDLIELAVVPINEDRILVTDFGETGRYLANHGYNPLSTPNGREVLGRVTSRIGIDNGTLEMCKETPVKGLGEAVFDVLLGCLAMGDMLYLIPCLSAYSIRG